MIKQKIKATVLAAVMLITLLAGCNTMELESVKVSSNPKTAQEVIVSSKTLKLGVTGLNQNVSPFDLKTEADNAVMKLTQTRLLDYSRGGTIVTQGINGQTISYNGTEYSYTGLANCEVTQNDDGTADYNFVIRDDVTFSDGEKLTADDVLFTMYVMADPAFMGDETFASLPIAGMEEYRSDMKPLGRLIFEKGEDNTDFTHFTEAEQTEFWAYYYNDAVKDFAQEIIDFCAEEYANYLPAYDNDEVILAAKMWGLENIKQNPTVADLAAALLEKHENDYAAMEQEESAGSTLALFTIKSSEKFLNGISLTDEAVNSVEGIEKTGEYSFVVHMSSYSASDLKAFTFYVLPMHYYCGKETDAQEGFFGFQKGQLAMLNNDEPIPCSGAYIAADFEENVLTLTKNPDYFKGEPSIATIKMLDNDDSAKAAGVAQGSLDMSDILVNKVLEEYIGLSDAVRMNTYVSNSYGYIGMNSNNVKVGNDPLSEQSRSLRQAFAEILSAYRSSQVYNFYGTSAAIAEYPAPASLDYVPNSTGGNSTLTDTERYAAAMEKGIELFKAAGYTWDETTATFSAAPEGASLIYSVKVTIPDSVDYPMYNVVSAATQALGVVGIILTASLETGAAAIPSGEDTQMWVGMFDPWVDLENNYSSKNGGNIFGISSDTLDGYFRQGDMTSAINEAISLACEVPIFSTVHAAVYHLDSFVEETVAQDITYLYGQLDEIEKLQMK